MTVMLQDKIEHAVKTVEDFSTLLDRETAALKAADYKTFETMQELKMSMAQAYQDAVLSFEDDIEAMQSLHDAEKTRLVAVHLRYQTAVGANQSALLNAKKVTERIVSRIMDAAKRSVSDGPAYNARGRQGLSEKIPVHFKLNEVL